MADVTEEPAAKESATFQRLWLGPNCSQLKRASVANGHPRLDSNLEQVLSDIIDSLPFHVLLLDAQRRILQVNQAVQIYLGLEPQDIIGKHCPKVMHGAGEPFYACPLKEAVEKDQPVEIETLDRKSGRWVNEAIYPTRGFTRDYRRIYLGLVIDIDDHKQTEERLIASRKQLRSLLAHLESVRGEERKKMARDLHDNTGQDLASLVTNLEVAASTLPAGANKPRAILDRAQALSIHVLDDLHKLIYELRPALLDDLGCVVDLEPQADGGVRPLAHLHRLSYSRLLHLG